MGELVDRLPRVSLGTRTESPSGKEEGNWLEGAERYVTLLEVHQQTRQLTSPKPHRPSLELSGTEIKLTPVP